MYIYMGLAKVNITDWFSVLYYLLFMAGAHFEMWIWFPG